MPLTILAGLVLKCSQLFTLSASIEYANYDVIRGQRSRTNYRNENPPISSYENFLNTTDYELSVFLSYFLVQLAVLNKKNYIY